MFITRQANLVDEEENQGLLHDRAMLDLVRLLPYYLTSESTSERRPIDVTQTVILLREITSAMNGPPQLIGSQVGHLVTSMILGATQLHVGFTSANQQQAQEKPNVSGAFISSWSGMAAASILYVIEGPLSPRRADLPTRFATICLLFGRLRNDLKETKHLLARGLHNRNMWLWKAFITFVAVTKAEKGFNNQDQVHTMRGFRNTARNLIAWWIDATKVVEWEIAREALYSVAWGGGLPEGEVEKLWQEALEV